MSSGLFLFHPIKHSLKAKLHMQKLKDSEWYRQFSRAQQHFATALKAEGQGNAAESGRIRGKNGARTPQERRKNGASKTQERRKNRIVRPHSRLFQPELNRCVHGRLLSSAALCRARQVASTSRLEVERRPRLHRMQVGLMGEAPIYISTQPCSSADALISHT